MELSTTPDVQAEFQPTSSKLTKGRKRNQKSTSADVFEPPVEKTPRSIKRYNLTRNCDLNITILVVVQLRPKHRKSLSSPSPKICLRKSKLTLISRKNRK